MLYPSPIPYLYPYTSPISYPYSYRLALLLSLTPTPPLNQVVNAGTDMIPGGPIGNMHLLTMSDDGDDDEGLPAIDNGEAIGVMA